MTTAATAASKSTPRGVLMILLLLGLRSLLKWLSCLEKLITCLLRAHSGDMAKSMAVKTLCASMID